jgi:hypothetical protein
MYVLSYFCHEYDEADHQVVATSPRREPLKALIDEHRVKHAEYVRQCELHMDACRRREAELQGLAREYLRRNRHALREKRREPLVATFFDANGNWQVEEVPEWHSGPGVPYPDTVVARMQDALIEEYAQPWRLRGPYIRDILHPDRLDGPFEEPPGLTPPEHEFCYNPAHLTITDVPHLD